MNKQQIKELALANGFKLKEQPDGSMDLNPYVYDFAAALKAQWQECTKPGRVAEPWSSGCGMAPDGGYECNCGQCE